MTQPEYVLPWYLIVLLLFSFNISHIDYGKRSWWWWCRASCPQMSVDIYMKHWWWWWCRASCPQMSVDIWNTDDDDDVELHVPRCQLTYIWNTDDDDDVELHVPRCQLTYETLMMMMMQSFMSPDVSWHMKHWWWWWCRASCPQMSVDIWNTDDDDDAELHVPRCQLTY